MITIFVSFYNSARGEYNLLVNPYIEKNTTFQMQPFQGIILLVGISHPLLWGKMGWGF